MIDNNPSFEIALYPYELVTYGEIGSVCVRMQYNLIKKILGIMTDHQTLVVEFATRSTLKSKTRSPRVIITNGLQW